jgi:hypothetical protein
LIAPTADICLSKFAAFANPIPIPTARGAPAIVALVRALENCWPATFIWRPAIFALLTSFVMERESLFVFIEAESVVLMKRP